MAKRGHKSSNKKGQLPPSSYNSMMGSPMDSGDHPVDNVSHPHGNSSAQGPMFVPGNLNPSSSGM